MDGHRVAIVTGVPAPYREPVFQRFSEQSGITAKVFYCAKGHDDVAWQSMPAAGYTYDREFLPNWTPTPFQRRTLLGYVNTALWRRLDAFAPTYVIVQGYNQVTHLLAMAYCRRNGIPFALRSDSNVWCDRPTTMIQKIRAQMLHRIVPQANAVLYVGAANRAYWQRYGADFDQLVHAPYAVDNERIARLIAEEQLRRAPADGPTFLFTGRMVPFKRVDLLIEAFNWLVEERDARLRLVGDGPERDRLEDRQTTKARERTTWLGRLGNDDAIRQLAHADAFIFPSEAEPWGLVINEAMAAGVPVAAYKHCGSAIDLVRHHETGYRMEHLSVESVFQTLRYFASDAERTRLLGENARQHVARWNYEATVAGFVRAVQGSASVSDNTSEEAVAPAARRAG